MQVLEKPWLKQWPQGVPQSIDYPVITLDECLRQSAKHYPHNLAIIFYGTRITYGTLDELVSRFATALQDQGLKEGDRAAIYLPNMPQFVIAYYGILRAGGTVVCVSPLYKERELAHILQDSGAEILVAFDRLYSIVQAVRESTKLRTIITTSVRDYLPPLLRTLSPLKGVKSYECPDALNFADLLRKHPANPKPVQVDPNRDIAVLGYTGGTTGIPKGAMLTHSNLVSNVAQTSAWLPVRHGQESHMSALPFFHIYGMNTGMNTPVYTATTMIIVPDPRDISNLLKTLGKFKPTIFCGVPALYVAMLNRPDISKFNMKSIRACISGAAALPVEVQRQFEKVTGGRLVEGYGLTETSPVTHCNPLDNPAKNRPGSIGIPFPDTYAKIVDVETGTKDLPTGEAGELAIKGPQVMAGYWNKPDETKMSFREGWFLTGDIAKIDEDGYFYIVDRKKDMIDVGGLKVWPREVEEVLYEHPSVQEAAVVGVANPARGDEVVKAFVVLKQGREGTVTEEDIITHCKSKIAVYKAPALVEFRTDLPKTPVGKVLRRALKEEASAVSQPMN
jgi:long-chain acyl-CoA synthetase